MALAGAWCSHAGELLAEARDTELGAASLTRTASLALPTGDKSDRRHGCDTRDRTALKKTKGEQVYDLSATLALHSRERFLKNCKIAQIIQSVLHRAQMSRFFTNCALVSMNTRLGSTSSPINVWKI
jgi:hypothetical protein